MGPVRKALVDHIQAQNTPNIAEYSPYVALYPLEIPLKEPLKLLLKTIRAYWGAIQEPLTELQDFTKATEVRAADAPGHHLRFVEAVEGLATVWGGLPKW